MKLLKLLLLTMIATVSSHSNAALINNGTYTTDTETGLEWLDLSITDNQSYVLAASNNPRWRHATNAEIENLFGKMFVGYYDTHPFNYSSSLDSTVYADQESDIDNFISLFGETKANDFGIVSLGFYNDEDGVLRWIGVDKHPNAVTPWSRVYGLESTFSAEVYRESFNNESAGVFMVRASAVPIPSAAWLFGSGLLGLIGVARRKNV